MDTTVEKVVTAAPAVLAEWAERAVLAGRAEPAEMAERAAAAWRFTCGDA